MGARAAHRWFLTAERFDAAEAHRIGFVHEVVKAGELDAKVAACDIAVSVDTANYCLSEVRLGLIPATISPYVIRAMGERAAHRYFLTAERFDAAEAYRIGFVHEVVKAEQLDAKVAELARTLVNNGPAAMKACKQLVQDVGGRKISATLIAGTVEGIADIRATDEGREGIASFLGKRKPNWLLPQG
jgi:methylglutaconyl-CoA hydratase